MTRFLLFTSAGAVMAILATSSCTAPASMTTNGGATVECPEALTFTDGALRCRDLAMPVTALRAWQVRPYRWYDDPAQR